MSMIPFEAFGGSCETMAASSESWAPAPESEGGVITIPGAIVSGENAAAEEGDEGRAISAGLVKVGVLGPTPDLGDEVITSCPISPSRSTFDSAHLCKWRL